MKVVFVRIRQDKFLKAELSDDGLVDELLAKCFQETGIPVTETRLVYAGVPLNPMGKDGSPTKLSSYGLVHGSIIMYSLVATPGKAMSRTSSFHQKYGGSMLEKKLLTFKEENSILGTPKRSFNPRTCIITLREEDALGMEDENTFCTQMSCKHWLGPNTLASIVENSLNAKSFISCPALVSEDSHFSCDKIWPIAELQSTGAFSLEEISTIEVMLSRVFLRGAGAQECTRCHTPLVRLAVTKDNLVVCGYCKRHSPLVRDPNFCWCCLKPWLNMDSTTVCGNESCDSADPRSRILRTCPTKSLATVDKVPSIRSCPSCGTMIEHVSSCKHMKCCCGTEYCHICLSVKTKAGTWPCGFYSSPCKLAPIQQKIPGQEKLDKLECSGDSVI